MQAQAQSSTLITDPEALLNINQVSHLTGLGASTIRAMTASGSFPNPIKFGDARNSAVRYRRRAVLAWIDSFESLSQSKRQSA